MRRTINSIQYAFPNEKLMNIHFVNFPIWTILVIMATSLGAASDSMDSNIGSDEVSEAALKLWKVEFSTMVFTNVQAAFGAWIQFFILFLIFKSTKTDQIEKYGVKDLILDR